MHVRQVHGDVFAPLAVRQAGQAEVRRNKVRAIMAAVTPRVRRAVLDVPTINLLNTADPGLADLALNPNAVERAHPERAPAQNAGGIEREQPRRAQAFRPNRVEHAGHGRQNNAHQGPNNDPVLPGDEPDDAEVPNDDADRILIGLMSTTLRGLSKAATSKSGEAVAKQAASLGHGTIKEVVMKVVQNQEVVHNVVKETTTIVRETYKRGMLRIGKKVVKETATTVITNGAGEVLSTAVTQTVKKGSKMAVTTTIQETAKLGAAEVSKTASTVIAEVSVQFAKNSADDMVGVLAALAAKTGGEAAAESVAKGAATGAASSTLKTVASEALFAGAASVVIDSAFIAYDGVRYWRGDFAQGQMGPQLKSRLANVSMNLSGNAIGAAIGTCMCPGWGTFLGGFVGSMISGANNYAVL
jgi:hypothetical protein